MKYYIPPKPNETTPEFWARMAKMGAKADDVDVVARSPRLPHGMANIQKRPYHPPVSSTVHAVR